MKSAQCTPRPSHPIAENYRNSSTYIERRSFVFLARRPSLLHILYFFFFLTCTKLLFIFGIPNAFPPSSSLFSFLLNFRLIKKQTHLFRGGVQSLPKGTKIYTFESRPTRVNRIGFFHASSTAPNDDRRHAGLFTIRSSFVHHSSIIEPFISTCSPPLSQEVVTKRKKKR